MVSFLVLTLFEKTAIVSIITYLRIVDYMELIFLGQPSVEVAVVVAAK